MSDVVERAKAALEGVTEGPWDVVHGAWGNVWHFSDDAGSPPLIVRMGGMTQPDAEFIAQSRTLVPELVAEVERLRAELLAERMSESRALAECRSELAEMTLSRAELGDEVQKLRNWRDGDRGRTELGELRATVGRIREALAGHPKCDVHPDDGVTCGWKKAVASVQWALDGAEAAR